MPQGPAKAGLFDYTLSKQLTNMATFSIGEPSVKPKPQQWTPFALGFRPFFLLAGLSAVLMLAWWSLSFTLGPATQSYYGHVGWHGHEMIFGYSIAVVAGFLLTAARNWTGFPTLNGKPLAALALWWVLGRILPFFPLPAALIAVVDLSFLPILAFALFRPLWKGQHYKSFLFVVMILGMALANLFVHLDLLGYMENTARFGLYSGLYLILILIALMGGRVIPYFTERSLEGFTRGGRPMIEYGAFATLMTLAIADSLELDAIKVALAALFTGLFHALRYWGWFTPRVFSVPLLWVLHSAYLWLIVGFFLKFAAAQDWVSPFVALHALTVGGIGIITLGMMARVGLGHTGRELVVPSSVIIGFGLINLAALLRVVMPLAAPGQYPLWVALSGALWAMSFALFVLAYLPMLLKSRVDGQPG